MNSSFNPARSYIPAGIFLILLCLLAAFSFHRVQPDPGWEAVLIKKPIFIGHGGIVDTPVSTGSEWVARTTNAVMVYVQPKQFTFSVQDLQSSNGIPLHFDAVIRLQVTDSVLLMKRFGPTWYDNNVSTEFASYIRQAVRKHDMNELAIQTTGVDAVDKEVTDNMKAYIERIGLPVKLLKVTVGKATPPEEIRNQRIATAAQEQRKQTEAQTKLAEDAREAAERSRATADNAYRQTLNLSPHEFVELQRIDMMKNACGQQGAHCTFIVGNNSGTPVISSK